MGLPGGQRDINTAPCGLPGRGQDTEEFPADGGSDRERDKRASSQPPQARAREPCPGASPTPHLPWAPLCALWEDMQVSEWKKRRETGLWSVLRHPTPQKKHQLTNLASQNELPKSPSSGVTDSQMSRSTLRVRHGLPSSPLLLWKGFLSSESTLLIPLTTGPGFSQFPPPPLAQIPAFLGRQQATGMLGFPLYFLRTGLFFHPKPSRAPES